MLSLVAIGKNEAEHIERLVTSIRALQSHVGQPVETIYVDSASTDASVEIAARHFDKVVELESDPNLCASAGRYAGTLEATGTWVFYIDADMEICEEFFPVIADLDNLPDDCHGVIGGYVHRFDNGTTAFQGHEGNVLKSEWAGSVGGASIMRRVSVLAAGNWNPCVFGKEEMDLYARLGNGRRVMRYFPLPMIYHYSEFYSAGELFRRLLYPAAGQGKVFYGFGQSQRALLAVGKLGALIRLDFEPYLVWLLMLAGLFAATALGLVAGVLLLAVEIIVLALWMKTGPLMRYLLLPINLILGWGKYVPDFRPVVRESRVLAHPES